jgi:hypothetical protein
VALGAVGQGLNPRHEGLEVPVPVLLVIHEADYQLRFDVSRKPVIRPISRNRMLESLKEAASWPEADKGTLVTLAAALVAARADAEGSSYFQDLSDKNPANATALDE